MSPKHRKTLVVAGHGMVGHRFVQAAIERGLTETHDLVVVGEESRPAYDRVALTSFFEVGAAELSFLPSGEYADPRVRLLLGTTVDGFDPETRTVFLSDGQVLAYDELVLATGAAPFVPPVPGHDLDGCFVYRSIEDLEAIRAAAAAATVGAVVGGGLLGLEAANALAQLGLETHVVEMAPRLMAVQVDDAGGATLVRHIEKLGLTAHTGAVTERVLGEDRVEGLALAGEEPIPAEVVVFSAGIRPRDQLAGVAGLDLAERGGVLVDERCRTSDEHVWAIGECAAPGGRMYGLVAPGYAMAEVVVDALLGGPGAFTGADMSTKLKLLGVDVASFGDAFATTEGALELVYADAVQGVYKKLVISADGRQLLGGILVGDASAYGVLRPMVSSGIALPDNPEELILPAGRGGSEIALPDEAQVCSCNDVTKAQILAAVDEGGTCDSASCVTKCTKAGSTCGSCKPVVKKVVEEFFSAQGMAVDKSLCEHFPMTRRELFDVVAVHGDGEHASVCLLPYRAGKLVDKRELHFEGVGDVAPGDILATFLAQYYDANPAVPPVVETAPALDAEEATSLAAFLAHLRGRAVRITAPQRGAGARRVELALGNARTAFKLRFRAPRSQAHHLERRLGEALGLDRPVTRLECFDISHASGKETTASCVVWASGRMERGQYRSFLIKGVSGVDDFAAIAEAVGRRYRRQDDEGRELPGLVLVDGGVGQLNAAMAAVDALGLDLALAALAKREELVYLPGRGEPLVLDRHDPAHLVLRQVRDEAHRFAVSRLRRRRRATTLTSEVLKVPGVGPGRAKALLTRFGSVRGIQQAALAELQGALGPRLGEQVFRHLHAAEGR